MPVRLIKVRKADIDKEILRTIIKAELDAVKLYEQMAVLTDNKHIKTVLLDISREEKTHVGKFQSLLLQKDGQPAKELEETEKGRRVDRRVADSVP
jgi:rubrerythrin